MTISIEPRQLTPEIVQRLIALIEAGSKLDNAGYVVGARPTTLKRWISEDPLLRVQIDQALEAAQRKFSKKVTERAFNAPIREAYLELLAQGNGRKSAANLCGLSEASLTWLIHNDEEFHREVEHAEAEAESFFIGRVRRDAEQSGVGRAWLPALEWLKRRRPSEWGDIQRLEVVQQLEQLKKAQEELAAEGIHVPLDQWIDDLKAIQNPGKKSSRPRALPPPVE